MGLSKEKSLKKSSFENLLEEFSGKYELQTILTQA
jgi:hypothetical protein